MAFFCVWSVRYNPIREQPTSPFIIYIVVIVLITGNVSIYSFINIAVIERKYSCCKFVSSSKTDIILNDIQIHSVILPKARANLDFFSSMTVRSVMQFRNMKTTFLEGRKGKTGIRFLILLQFYVKSLFSSYLR